MLAELGSSGHAVKTPELVAVAHCEGGQGDRPPSGLGKQPARLFDIFRPKTQRKMLIIVRHGESEYNKAVLESKHYSDPLIFDPRLTQKGLVQCKELQQKLATILAEKRQEFGEPLWDGQERSPSLAPDLPPADSVTPSLPDAQQPTTSHDSPVGRARQCRVSAAGSTTQQDTGRPGSRGGSEAGCPPWGLRPASDAGSSFSSSSLASAPSFSSMPLAKLVEVLPCIAEFLVTAGDVGRPASVLSQEFPQGRIAEFTRWLNGRPESLFVLIGHGSYWYNFMGKQKRMHNCEVIQMSW
ncbi:hypothetical protein V8C86DRAFT_3105332 [Haematococcus lacustris]